MLYVSNYNLDVLHLIRISLVLFIPTMGFICDTLIFTIISESKTANSSN